MRIIAATLVLGLSLALVACGQARGPVAEVYAEGGIALRGQDPVAYFSEGRARAGSEELTHEWKGVTWRFASRENRTRFQEEPSRYAPQFGGWCAWAVSQGYTAPTDPDAFDIVDGKLYLNYNADIQARWRADRPALITRGHANWPGLLAP